VSKWLEKEVLMLVPLECTEQVEFLESIFFFLL
jgi:hypothetical protein